MLAQPPVFVFLYLLFELEMHQHQSHLLMGPVQEHPLKEAFLQEPVCDIIHIYHNQDP